MHPTQALRELGGAADTATLLQVCSRKQLRTAVTKGLVVRPRRGRYALPADGGTAHILSLGGVLSHQTAARMHGWEVANTWIDPEVVLAPSVALDPRAARNLTLRRWDLAPQHVQGPVTTPMQTVLMCAADLPLPESLAVADSALRHGSITSEELLRASETWRGPHPDRVVRVAHNADARAANPFESALRAHCLTAGLDVVPQWEIEAMGRVWHPDLADPLRGIAVEADSFTHHAATPQSFEQDCFRYNAFVATGWIVLRFTWQQVMTRGHEVVWLLQTAMKEWQGRN